MREPVKKTILKTREETLEEINKLSQLVKPIQEWLDKNGTPHDVIIIQDDRFDIYSGRMGGPRHDDESIKIPKVPVPDMSGAMASIKVEDITKGINVDIAAKTMMSGIRNR